MSVGSAGLAVAQGSGGKGKTGGAPPGNNGTIKIDPNVIGPVGSANVDHANHPHVACQFAVSFFGYDATTDNAVVNFFAQPPSGKFQPVTPIVGPGSFSFTGHGPGNILDASVLYQLDVTGLKANVNQGYHIKVDVEVTDGLLPNGSDDKYKVFWLAPCSVPTTTTSTTPTTLTPTSSTLPEKGSTTTTPSTTTSTTSTTLTPTSSTVPEEGSTTTTPSTTTVATTVPRSSTTTTPRSTPPTTARGTGGQTGTTSTTRPSTHPAAAGSAPGAPSGLAFTNGPVPSGAGTDLGFFSPGSPSSLPWLLIIVGGVLLSGAGTVTLTGSRIRKWIVRA